MGLGPGLPTHERETQGKRSLFFRCVVSEKPFNSKLTLSPPPPRLTSPLRRPFQPAPATEETSAFLLFCDASNIPFEDADLVDQQRWEQGFF